MASSYVRVYYGPSDSFHTIAHKPQKLRGLKDRLQRRGYRVDIVPVTYINYCMLEMCGHEVFRCNMKSLKFNMPFELDEVCQRAVAAVEESSMKLKRARCYLWFCTLLEQEMFKRSPFAPQDHWPEHFEVNKTVSCLDCARCCDLLVSKKASEHHEL